MGMMRRLRHAMLAARLHLGAFGGAGLGAGGGCAVIFAGLVRLLAQRLEWVAVACVRGAELLHHRAVRPAAGATICGEG